MKKISLLIIVVLSLFAFNNAKAQCGISSSTSSYATSRTYTLSDGCKYYVDLCVDCESSFTGFNPINMAVSKIVKEPNCSSSLSTSQRLDELREILRNSFFNFCPDRADAVPPCGTGNYFDINVGTNTCWYKKNTNGFIEYIPCAYPDNNYCWVQYYYCKNQNGIYQWYINYKTFSPSAPTCSTGEPNDPLPGLVSTCFKIDTPCQ